MERIATRDSLARQLSLHDVVFPHWLDDVFKLCRLASPTNVRGLGLVNPAVGSGELGVSRSVRA